MSNKRVTIWQMANAWAMDWRELAGVLGHGGEMIADGTYPDYATLLTDEDQAWCEETARLCDMWAPSDIIAGRI